MLSAAAAVANQHGNSACNKGSKGVHMPNLSRISKAVGYVMAIARGKT
jgi:hypothetical protein